MAFNLEKALENDGKCIVVQRRNHGRYPARIICSDRLDPVEGKWIIVLYESDNTEHIAEFDENWVFCSLDHGKSCTLENVPETVGVWVVAYRHKRQGNIQTSAKFSKASIEETRHDLVSMGHTIIGMNQLTISEGEDNV